MLLLLHFSWFLSGLDHHVPAAEVGDGIAALLGLEAVTQNITTAIPQGHCKSSSWEVSA